MKASYINAINNALTAALSYGEALATLRSGFAAGDFTLDDVRPIACEAMLRLDKKGAYRGQLVDGKPVRDSALAKAVQRFLRDIKGAGDKAPKQSLQVPREVQLAFDAAWKLAAKYEQAGKLAATALATARAK